MERTAWIDYESSAEDYQRIEQAIRYLEGQFQFQPDLAEVAAQVGLSEYHFQRLFTRWVGISPKRFLQFLTKECAKELLVKSENLLDVSFTSGLSGPGRLHDLFVTCEAVTPGEFKRLGEGLTIRYGFHASPFGECLLALTERGICGLSFIIDGDRGRALEELARRWPRAVLQEDAVETRHQVRQLFAYFDGREGAPLSLYLRGTNFQLKVWEALLRIPPGSAVSYERLAATIGTPGAVRAVGTAVGHNPIPILIPCHRVIRKVGDFGGYRWGEPRKKAVLAWELARGER